MGRFGEALRPVAVNLLAHGSRGGWHGAGPLTLAEEARVIAEATDGEEAPFHLVGHSYGGGVALRARASGAAAIDGPDRAELLPPAEGSGA